MPLKIAALLLVVTAQPSAHGQDPSSVRSDPLLRQASDALSKRDYVTAETLLAKLVAASPNDAHLLFDLGLVEEHLAHPDRAESDYRRATVADPKDASSHLALGLLLARSGKNSDSRPELFSASTLPSGDPAIAARALRALARLDLAARPSDARDELLRAVKISPESADDSLLSAQIAEALNDLPVAEAAYLRFLTKAPNDPSATAALGHLLLLDKKPAEAETLLTMALVAHPGDTALTAQLAATYLAGDDSTKSAQSLPLVETLHSEHPDNVAVTRLLARLYVQMKQPEKAGPLYATLVAASPSDSQLLGDAASNLIQLRRSAEAEGMLKRAIASPATFASPEDLAAAYSDLAFAASENNDPATTLQALDLRAKIAPITAGSLFLQATAHDKLHEVKQAVEAYRQFLALADGKFPDQEWETRHRLITLEHTK